MIAGYIIVTYEANCNPSNLETNKIHVVQSSILLYGSQKQIIFNNLNFNLNLRQNFDDVDLENEPRFLMNLTLLLF